MRRWERSKEVQLVQELVIDLVRLLEQASAHVMVRRLGLGLVHRMAENNEFAWFAHFSMFCVFEGRKQIQCFRRNDDCSGISFGFEFQF